MHEFDKTYWEDHWAPAASDADRNLPVNPYLPLETKQLPVGTALDAGCGTGTEALWLAEQGWQVTGADISRTALAAAASRASAADLSHQIEWVETDVARWQPNRAWDLVVTHYAHPDTGQLAFYQHIGSWVALGGTLLIVAHQHDSDHSHDHGHDHPEGATTTQAEIANVLTASNWHIDSSYDTTRTVDAGGRTVQLHDVIVRARYTRRN